MQRLANLLITDNLFFVYVGLCFDLIAGIVFMRYSVGLNNFDMLGGVLFVVRD